ncbi:MAG: histidinol dehydrogenase, partial [Bacteroidota bacterium]
GIPAKLAGCQEIVLCTPPNKNGSVHPAILYTASLVGCTKIFKVGGAQAIGAMAFGTASVPSTYKIFGPGNQYVTAAKQLVNKMGTAIDMPAGPSEVLVCADESATPAFVAADLLSQAEHGVDSQVVLVAFQEATVQAIQEELTVQLSNLSRAEVARKALTNSVAIVASDRTEAQAIINTYAPEHLILSVENEMEFSEGIVNAGSIFLGNYTPESVGDYASGTNHTLPTNGHARAYSGVSLDTFVKKITFQKLTKEGLQNIGPSVAIMAAAECLDAHQKAVTIRLETEE